MNNFRTVQYIKLIGGGYRTNITSLVYPQANGINDYYTIELQVIEKSK